MVSFYNDIHFTDLMHTCLNFGFNLINTITREEGKNVSRRYSLVWMLINFLSLLPLSAGGGEELLRHRSESVRAKQAWWALYFRGTENRILWCARLGKKIDTHSFQPQKVWETLPSAGEGEGVSDVSLFRRASPGGSSIRIRILSALVCPEETCPFLIFFVFVCSDACPDSLVLGPKVLNFQRAFPLKAPCRKLWKTRCKNSRGSLYEGTQQRGRKKGKYIRTEQKSQNFCQWHPPATLIISLKLEKQQLLNFESGELIFSEFATEESVTFPLCIHCLLGKGFKEAYSFVCICVIDHCT